MNPAGIAQWRNPAACLQSRKGDKSAPTLRKAAFFSVISLMLAGAASGQQPVTHGANAASSSMIYIDTALVPDSKAGAPNRTSQHHPLYRQLSMSLADYRSTWGDLPMIEISPGPPLGGGVSGDRVERLRERLGLQPSGAYDLEVEGRVRDFQSAHGLPVDGVAGPLTIEALNRGPGHYERLIQANLERAAALPSNPGRRYVLVDAASAMLYMYEDGQPVDSMRVIVGKPSEQTPMLAAYLRYAVLNPYWNVPPDLVRRNIAPRVLEQGESWLRSRGYEVLSGWESGARPVDPSTVDWRSVVRGETEIRVRQKPGNGNMMGEAKFMISDELGIFLHDTPNRDLFDSPDRRLSSGCIRLEDVERFSQWLFESEVQPASDRPEHRIDLPEPVPVLVTYLTTAPADQGLVFRNDIYGRDQASLASMAP